jgi:PhnB protein
MEHGANERREVNREKAEVRGQRTIDFDEAAPSRIMSISNSNTSVQPYLFFGGRCEEALDFYRNAVGAEVQMVTRFKESPEPHGLPDCFDNKIMHATVRIGKTTLMASDGQCEGNQDFEGFALSITVSNETEVERVFAALGQGGLITCRWRRRSGRQNSACYRIGLASPG